MIKNGLMCSAIVLPGDVFTTFKLEELGNQVGAFELQMFDSFPDAETWVFKRTNCLSSKSN
jgi:hypothetical protein